MDEWSWNHLKGGGGGGGGGAGGRLKNFFGRRGLNRKGGQFLEWGSGFLQITIKNVASQLLFDLVFMCRLKDVASLLFYIYSFSLFHFINYF